VKPSNISGLAFHHKECFDTETDSLTPVRLIEVPVPRQESEQSCIWVLGVSIFSIFQPFFYYILELFRQRFMFCFHFIEVRM